MNLPNDVLFPSRLSCKLVLFLAFYSMSHAPTALGMQIFSSEFTGSAPRLFEINPDTAQTVLIGPTRFVPGLDFSANNVLYGSSSSLSTISTSTGMVTDIGALPELIVSIAFSPNGALFGIGNGNSMLYRLDPGSGVSLGSVSITGTVHLNSAPFPGEIRGIDFTPDGRLFGIGFGLYTIDVNTGIATRITPSGQRVGGNHLFQDLDFGSDGLLRSVSYDQDEIGSSNLYTVNPTTGLGQFVGATAASMVGIASVPEPDALMLMVLGVVATVYMGNRRGQKVG